MTALTWADGVEIRGGAPPTAVDLDELGAVVGLLRAAAGHLDAAAAALSGAVRAVGAVLVVGPTAAAAYGALEAVRSGSSGPAGQADEVRGLATRLRAVAAGYAAAESWSRWAVDRAAAQAGTALAQEPLVGVLLAVLAFGAVVPTGPDVLGRMVGHPELLPVLTLVSRVHEPMVLRRFAALGSAGADGRTETGVNLAAGGLLAWLGRSALPSQPVAEVARSGAGALAAAAPGRVVVQTRRDPPVLPAPRDVADVLTNVARSYRAGTVTGDPGTPAGAVTLQRLDHPDGTRAWVVEIPGTQDWAPGSAVPADLLTNLQVLAGSPDDMTETVVQAMDRAGVRPTDPVLLAGHSQGGMVAQRVADARRFDVRAVLTAGSPDVLRRVPAGVQVRHYRHREDVVPQLGGRPARVGPQVAVVTQDLGIGTTPVTAHDVRRYADTARSTRVVTDASPSSRDFDAAVAEVLGPQGTTATTTQFWGTRASEEQPLGLCVEPPGGAGESPSRAGESPDGAGESPSGAGESPGGAGEGRVGR